MSETIPVTPGALRALAARYRYQEDRLKQASEANPPNQKVMNMAMAAMTKVEEEAVALGQTLQQILTIDTSQVNTVVTNNKLTPANPLSKLAKPKSVTEAERIANRAKAIAEEKQAQGQIPGQTRTQSHKKGPVKMRPCLDGCGEMVAGNFRMGHDAKLKSLILKIERGEEDQSVIPEIAQDLIKFKKGELVTERNSEGKEISKTQEWICTAAPVKFPGRDGAVFELTVRED